MIDALGLPGFFLLHRDMLELAREVAAEVRGPDTARALLPPGRGRGSSVSSIVCYLTGLSHIDPIANELFLGRFLNEELTALPDIDLDFPRDIREVLIPRVHDRYGREHSALVAAFPTFQSRGAIRELGKVLGLPAGRARARRPRGRAVRDPRRGGRRRERARARARRPARAVARPRPRRAPFAMTHRRVAGDGQRARPGDSPRSGRARTTRALRRAARPLGVAGAPVRRGLRAAAPPLPALRRDDRLHPPAGRLLPRRCPPRWRAASCASGTRTPAPTPASSRSTCSASGCSRRSSAAWRTSRARATSGSTSRASRSTTRPPTTAIQDADTMGVFQIESRAQMAVAAAHAARDARRPHDPGRDRAPRADPRRRRQPLHRAPPAAARGPGLRRPLRPPVARARAASDTLGTIIFQDQVLEVAIAFAGFSPGEAEGLRRAMSRKRSEAAIEAYHRRFVEGAGADPRRRRGRPPSGSTR